VIAGLTPLRVEVAFWALLFGALAAGIGLETDWGQQWQWPVDEVAQQAAVLTNSELTEPYRLPSADVFIDVAMRPIFVFTRQPPPPLPPPEPPKPAMKKDQFVLTGVTIVPEGKFAFLIEKVGGKTRVATEGKEINGIMVKEIRPDRVVLTQYDDTEVLALRVSKASATTTAGPNSLAPPGTAGPNPLAPPGLDPRAGQGPPPNNKSGKP
jgi:hypothetical protein